MSLCSIFIYLFIDVDSQHLYDYEVSEHIDLDTNIKIYNLVIVLLTSCLVQSDNHVHTLFIHIRLGLTNSSCFPFAS